MSNKTIKPIYTIIDKTIKYSHPDKPPTEFNVLECHRRPDDEGLCFDNRGIIINFCWDLWPGLSVRSIYRTHCCTCDNIFPGCKVVAIPQPFYIIGNAVAFKWYCETCLDAWLRQQ